MVRESVREIRARHDDNDDEYDPIYPTPPLGLDMTQGQFF